MEARYVLDYDVVTVQRPQRVYLMAQVQAGPSPGSESRRPLNIGVVLDRSGSMGGDKLAYVKQAAQFLVGHLGARDLFSLVTFDHAVKVVLEPETPTAKDRIRQHIEKIRTGGTTNLSGGWLKGIELVERALEEERIHRVLLLTDGLANQGITDPERLVNMARQKREQGITTTTMGVGEGFNEDLLQEMANAGGGGFYFIETPDDAPALFAEELHELLSVVAQNLTITLTLSPEVTLISQLNAYPMTTRDHVVEFLLHDLFGDELKTLLLELHIPALESLGPSQIGHLRFDFDEILEDRAEHRTVDLPLVVNVVPADALPAEAPHPEVTRSVLLLKSAQAKEEAVRQADQGDFEAASQVLSDTAALIRESGIEDNDLSEEEKELSTRSAALKDRDKYDETMRKQMKFYAHAARTGHMSTSQLMRDKHMDMGDEDAHKKGTKPHEDKPESA